MAPNFASQRPQSSSKQRPLRLSAASAMLLLTLWQGNLLAEEATWRYSLSPGDNPWSITERFLKGMQYWQPLLRLNNIEQPRLLPPGTELSIPLRWLKTEAANTRVKEAAGDASYISAADGETRPLQPDTLLTAGDRIAIGERGSAVLEYTDGTTLFLGSNTAVNLQRVDKFSDSGLADNEVKLEAGRTENRVTTRGTRFEISTPSASTAVRGTQFRTSVDRQESGLSRVEVLAGSVVVGGAGKNRNVRAGFGTTVRQGEPPAPPSRLLPEPEIELPTGQSRAFPLEIRWLAVKGAGHYRLQIKAAGSATPLLDEVTTRTGLSTDALDDGRYTLALRAIDKAGLEDREQLLELLLDAQPQPPLAVTPQVDQVVRSELPAFEWTRPLGGSSVHFQLTVDPQAKPLLDMRDYPGTRFTPDTLQPGSYFWRLATRNEAEEGPWSEYQPFTLKPAPGEPEVSSEGDGQHIRLRWPTAGEGRRYRVQLAARDDFNPVTEEQVLDQPFWEAERPPMLSYFRVRVIDTDAYEGAWSATQIIDPAQQPWYLFVIPTALLLLLAL